MKNFFPPPRPRIVISVGDDGIVVVPYLIAEATPFFTSFRDEDSLEKAKEFLSAHPEARLTFFADNLTQDYRIDDLPRLNALDRIKLIRRRLKQTFPFARLTSHLNFKGDAQRALFIGLHESNVLFHWADQVEARLPDIALLPVEGADLLPKLSPGKSLEWILLVSRHKSGGFRQIVTHKGNLVFTRLTPLPQEDVLESEALTIARDIKASIDYLLRLNLREAKNLSVVVLLSENEALLKALEPLTLKSVSFFSPAQAAKRLRLPMIPDDGDMNGDLIFASYLLSKTRARKTFMLPKARKAWMTATLQRWGFRLSLTFLVLVALLTLWRAGDLVATLYSTQKEIIQLAQTRLKLSQERSHTAPLTEPLGQLRQALERRHIFEQAQILPWHGFTELSSGLLLEPRFIMTGLDWKTDVSTATETVTATFQYDASTQENEPLEITASFARLVQALARAMPDYTITNVKTPYPSTPNETVTTETNQGKEAPVGEIALERKTP